MPDDNLPLTVAAAAVMAVIPGTEDERLLGARLLTGVLGSLLGDVPTDPVTGEAVAVWARLTDLATRLERVERLSGFLARENLGTGIDVEAELDAIATGGRTMTRVEARDRNGARILVGSLVYAATLAGPAGVGATIVAGTVTAIDTHPNVTVLTIRVEAPPERPYEVRSAASGVVVVPSEA